MIRNGTSIVYTFTFAVDAADDAADAAAAFVFECVYYRFTFSHLFPPIRLYRTVQFDY